MKGCNENRPGHGKSIGKFSRHSAVNEKVEIQRLERERICRGDPSCQTRAGSLFEPHRTTGSVNKRVGHICFKRVIHREYTLHKQYNHGSYKSKLFVLRHYHTSGSSLMVAIIGL